MDFVKIWVDDRNGKYKKLTPELYGAVIDEAHKHKLRVTVHVFYLEDAKGLFRAGIDAFAHGVRDLDVDDELMAMVKKPDFVLVPNMPDRGRHRHELAQGQRVRRSTQEAAGRLRMAEGPESVRDSARNLAKFNAAGAKIALGTDGNVAWSQHVEMEDMVASGMTPHPGHRRRDPQRRPVAGAEGSRDGRHRHERRLRHARRQPD